MKANGFGSWQQNIVLHVALEQAEEVRAILGVEPFKVDGDPPRAYFLWTRWTRRRGDDEDVVWELFVWLDKDRYDWKIDWRASEY